MEEAFRNPALINTIIRALKKGNTVELRREKGNIVVIESERKVRIKTPYEKVRG